MYVYKYIHIDMVHRVCPTHAYQSAQNSFMIYFPMNNISNVKTLVRIKLALFETFSLFQGIQDL